MKANPKCAVATMVLIIGTANVAAWAGPSTGATSCLLARLAVGQSDAASKKDVGRLLVMARQAMRDAEYGKADALISQAEKKNVRYSISASKSMP